MAEIEMIIDSIRVSLQNNQRVVILKEKQGIKYLPIWIGPAEADCIAVKIQGVSVPRPLTHDFLVSVMDTVGATISSVVINKLENDTFYAETIIKNNGETISIDCRPSDALAMAVRTEVPIYADEKVLDKAGILLDSETGNPVESDRSNVSANTQDESNRVDKFSAEVREIFSFAEDLAKLLHGNYIGTGHLLVAILRKVPNTAIDILNRLNVNMEELNNIAELHINDEKAPSSDQTTLNDNAKKAMEFSLEEASNLGSLQVLPEHLLLGLLREQTGRACHFSGK
jgi:bifunctional DNase/RNase